MKTSEFAAWVLGFMEEEQLIALREWLIEHGGTASFDKVTFTFPDKLVTLQTSLGEVGIDISGNVLQEM